MSKFPKKEPVLFDINDDQMSDIDSILGENTFSTLLAYNGLLKDLIEEFNNVSDSLLFIDRELEHLTCHEKDWNHVAEKNENLNPELKSYLISELSKEPKREPLLEKLNIANIHEHLVDLKVDCQQFLWLSSSLAEENRFDSLPIMYSIIEGMDILDKYCNIRTLAGVDLKSILEYEYNEMTYKYFLELVSTFRDGIHTNTANRLTHISKVVNNYVENATSTQKLPTDVTARCSDDQCIKKGYPYWEFFYDKRRAVVSATYKGLKLIEHLLLNPHKNFYPLELLRETGLREDYEKESNDTTLDAVGILQIQENIKQKEEEYEQSNDPSEKTELKEDIEKLCSYLRKSRNKDGEPRQLQDANRISVYNLIERVCKQIEEQNKELYSHFKKFINTTSIVSYTPDSDIDWYIS